MQLHWVYLLLLHGLLSGLGLLALGNLGGGGLDDTDGHGLPHVTDGAPSYQNIICGIQESANTNLPRGG